MPNQPSKNKVQRALRVEWTLDAKILKQFRTDDTMSIKDAYVLALIYATRNVALTAEDYESIAKKVRRATSKRTRNATLKTKDTDDETK